jgi:dienelactone hydrolase
MKMKKTIAFLVVLILISIRSSAQLTVNFPSKDGLKMTADWYPISSEQPVILLCHMNASSRGEYKEIATRLNQFGFNCLAIDQRVGSEINGIHNETAKNATQNKMTPKFEDAEQDIVAAVEYLHNKYKTSLIILGSSYSASLALKVASENENVSAVAVFSPGEYFDSTNYVASHIGTLLKPVFATSSREEADKVTDLLKDVNSRIKVQYIPTTKGDHGSKALWSNTPFNQEYWIALMSFLDKMKKMN